MWNITFSFRTLFWFLSGRFHSDSNFQTRLFPYTLDGSLSFFFFVLSSSRIIRNIKHRNIESFNIILSLDSCARLAYNFVFHFFYYIFIIFNISLAHKYLHTQSGDCVTRENLWLRMMDVFGDKFALNRHELWIIIICSTFRTASNDPTCKRPHLCVRSEEMKQFIKTINSILMFESYALSPLYDSALMFLWNIFCITPS